MQTNTKAKIITIVGNIASGKSTLVPILAKTFKAKAIHADNLFQTKNPFARLYLEQTKRWAFVNELWMTTERIKILKKYLKKQRKGITIIDSGILMSWVYTYSHLLTGNISKHEWKLYHHIYTEFAQEFFKNSGVIFLSYHPKTLLKRIAKRKRDFELKYYTLSYLEQINKGMDALHDHLNDKAVKKLIVQEKEITDFENNKRDRKKLINLVKAFVESL